MSEQTRTCATARRQCASRPVCLATLPCPVCFSGPRASRSSSLGRGVGPVFLLSVLSFSSLFCRFSVLVSWVFSRSRRYAVATLAIRGVSRGCCVASPCSGKVPRHKRAVALRAQGADPRTAHPSGIHCHSFVHIWYCRIYWIVLGLRFLPAVTSASRGRDR